MATKSRPDFPASPASRRLSRAARRIRFFARVHAGIVRSQPQDPAYTHLPGSRGTGLSRNYWGVLPRAHKDQYPLHTGEGGDAICRLHGGRILLQQESPRSGRKVRIAHLSGLPLFVRHPSQLVYHLPYHRLKILIRTLDRDISILLIPRDPLVIHLVEALAREEDDAPGRDVFKPLFHLLI